MAALLREEALRPSGGANSGGANSSGANSGGHSNPVKKSQKKKPAGNGKK
jgi:hypothetical protein